LKIAKEIIQNFLLKKIIIHTENDLLIIVVISLIQIIRIIEGLEILNYQISYSINFIKNKEEHYYC